MIDMNIIMGGGGGGNKLKEPIMFCCFRIQANSNGWCPYCSWRGCWRNQTFEESSG